VLDEKDILNMIEKQIETNNFILGNDWSNGYCRDQKPLNWDIAIDMSITELQKSFGWFYEKKSLSAINIQKIQYYILKTWEYIFNNFLSITIKEKISNEKLAQTIKNNLLMPQHLNQLNLFPEDKDYTNDNYLMLLLEILQNFRNNKNNISLFYIISQEFLEYEFLVNYIINYYVFKKFLKSKKDSKYIKYNRIWGEKADYECFMELMKEYPNIEDVKFFLCLEQEYHRRIEGC
jgi:hypothetical protein